MADGQLKDRLVLHIRVQPDPVRGTTFQPAEGLLKSIPMPPNPRNTNTIVGAGPSEELMKSRRPSTAPARLMIIVVAGVCMIDSKATICFVLERQTVFLAAALA